MRTSSIVLASIGGFDFARCRVGNFDVSYQQDCPQTNRYLDYAEVDYRGFLPEGAT